MSTQISTPFPRAYFQASPFLLCFLWQVILTYLWNSEMGRRVDPSPLTSLNRPQHLRGPWLCPGLSLATGCHGMLMCPLCVPIGLLQSSGLHGAPSPPLICLALELQQNRPGLWPLILAGKASSWQERSRRGRSSTCKPQSQCCYQMLPEAHPTTSTSTSLSCWLRRLAMCWSQVWPWYSPTMAIIHKEERPLHFAYWQLAVSTMA